MDDLELLGLKALWNSQMKLSNIELMRGNEPMDEVIGQTHWM